MKVSLLIRRKRDYKPLMDVEHKIRMWDDTFSMKFKDFRREIVDIAHDNHHLLDVDKIYGWLEDDTYSSLTNDDNGWVIPIDDDDWLATDLPSRLRNIESHTMVCWNIDAVFADTWHPGNIYTHEISYKNRIGRYGVSAVQSCAYALSNKGLAYNIALYHMDTDGVDAKFISGESGACYVNLQHSTTCLSRANTPDDLILSVIRCLEIPDAPFSRDEFNKKYTKIKQLYSSLL